MPPDLRHEETHGTRGPVAGVDEVGRGPLAGPVVAAAVILDRAAIPAGLDDSKRLSAAARDRLDLAIRASAVVGIGAACVTEIDALNILRASHLAMCRAVAALHLRPGTVLVDGHLVPGNLAHPAFPVIGGDALSLSIAAASIVAKVYRDRLMEDLAQQHPGYGWERNRGYATLQHRSALRDLGVTAYHRRSFAPIHNILLQAHTLTA